MIDLRLRAFPPQIQHDVQIHLRHLERIDAEYF